MEPVLLCFARYFSGHYKVAEAIQKASLKIERINYIYIAIGECIPFFELFYRLYLSFALSCPPLCRRLWKSETTAWISLPIRDLFGRFVASRIKRRLHDLGISNIKVGIATHVMAVDALLHICRDVLAVVTDYAVHPYWVSKKVKFYFVPTERAKEYLIEQGIDEASILVSGIPIDERFSESLSKEDLLREMGIVDLPTILISCGNSGVFLDTIVKKLKSLTDRVRIFVISGKNVNIYRKLKRKSNKNLYVFEYTDNLYRLLKVVDIFVGKPGGVSISECLVCSLPMVLIKGVGGQEFFNALYIQENNAGLVVNLGELKKCCENLLLSEGLRKQLSRNAKALGRADAASVVARRIKELLS